MEALFGIYLLSVLILDLWPVESGGDCVSGGNRSAIYHECPALQTESNLALGAMPCYRRALENKKKSNLVIYVTPEVPKTSRWKRRFRDMKPPTNDILVLMPLFMVFTCVLCAVGLYNICRDDLIDELRASGVDVIRSEDGGIKAMPRVEY
ncbi:hypothetical protein Q1695_013487 [Nippostrongylus brasiliensis]|nr:hypothetical protein Q1695_013487 [Nippostrongylus brasiliensis]